MATNPDDHIILDEETRSLLTPNCEAIIGGQVVDFCDPGIGTVGNGESSISLCSLNNGDCCWWGKDDDKLDYDNDDKFIIVYVSLKNKLGFGIPSKAKAKIISCKRKSGGGYKRFRTPLRISVGGQTFGENTCGSASNIFSKQKPANAGTKRKKKLRVAANLLFEIERAMDNDVVGIGFAGSNQLTFLSVPLVF